MSVLDRSAFSDRRPPMSDFPTIGSDLKGKRALVTGGAVGIGGAIAAALAAHGVAVAIADLDAARAAKSASEIGGGAIGLSVDVRDRGSVESAFASVLTKLGGCDIVCANAGVSTMRRAVDLTDEEWDFNFDVNVRGVFLTNQIAARHFLNEKHGVIVNTASLAGKVGAPLLAHYSAANSRWSAGPRRWRANWRRAASASMRSAPASCAPACRSARWCGRRSCAA